MIFGVCKIRRRFGAVLGESGGRVLAVFGTILAGFWGLEKESNFEAEVGRRKSGFKAAKGR